MSFVTLVAGFLIMLSASVASAQNLTLGTPTFGGNGCASGTARATLSPDGQQISILFDNYIATAGGYTQLEMDRKNCDIAIPVRVPQGYSVAVFAIDYRGFAVIPEGGRVRFSADYFFAGRSSRRYSKEYQGPFNDNYTFRNELSTNNEAAGRGQFVKAGVANLNNEPAVTQQCQSQYQQHRFSIPFTRDEAIRYANSKVWVHGISPVGLPNLTIGQSGRVVFPSFQKNLQGQVYNATDDGSMGNVISGHICLNSTARAVDVEVFVGGPAGVGTFVGTAKADGYMDFEAIRFSCRGFRDGRAFSVHVPFNIVRDRIGQSIFVYAVDPMTGNLQQLDGSGMVYITQPSHGGGA